MHTGQIPFWKIAYKFYQVHPRAYGADKGSRRAEYPHYDSSPYIRGGYTEALIWSCSVRLIPVYMGQICVVLSLSERAKVHPRAYGQTLRDKESCFSSRGSSPCIRGRILPQLYTLFLPWVHPRAYGADLIW